MTTAMLRGVDRRLDRAAAVIWTATIVIGVAYLVSPDRVLARSLVPMVPLTITAVMTIRRVRASPRELRLPWITLTVSLLGFAVSDLMIIWWPTLTGSPHPWPGPAHVPFQLALLALACSLSAFVRGHRRSDGAAALDAAVVAGSIGLVTWVLIVGPLLSSDLRHGPLATTILITHPLLHVALLVAAWRLGVSARRWTPARVALISSVVAIIATSAGMGLLALSGRYVAHGPLTVGWLVAAACIAVAASHPSAATVTVAPREGPEPAPRAPGRRIVAHAVASLVLPGLLLLRAEGRSDTIVAAVAAAILLLVTARVWNLLRELESARANDVEDQRERDRRRFEALVRHAADVLLVVGDDGRVAYASPSAANIFGVDPTGWTRSQLAAKIHPDERDATVAALFERLETSRGRPVKIRARFLDDARREVHAELVAVDLLDDPDVAGVVITLHDMTERASLEADLRHLAFHDPLTALPNRTLFQDRLVQALARATRSERRIAVLLCDLDDFKDVNDTLGHPAGDELLRVLASRFAASLRATDTVARIGGDEFAVLCEDVGSTRDAILAARRLLAATEEPIHVHDRELRVSLSVGIAVDGGVRSADELLRDADIALYEAKAEGKQRWSLHRTTMTARAQARLQLGADLADAVQRGGITLDFQPIHELAGGQRVGAEALARWTHPERGPIAPDEFISMAEQNGLILPLGDQVLDNAIGTIARWDTRWPDRPLQMGVNVSPRQLRDVALCERIEASLTRHGVAPGRLVLELTESVMLEDPDQALRVMHMLRDLGVRFAIDDFGTGYSSLAYLRQLPVDIVKIDRAFVHGLSDDAGALDLVRSIVDLASGMDLDVVAEGIETETQCAQLRALGCGFGQGYLFGRPTDESTFTNEVRPPAPSGPTVAADPDADLSLVRGGSREL